KLLNYMGDIYGRDGFTIRPILLRPKSRGSITLKSNNPKDAPNIDPRLLSHPDDVTTLVEGRHGEPLTTNPLPECRGEAYGSDAYWTCYVRHMSSAFYHLCGGCKMAPASDPVRGVFGLRVVGAPIMPAVTSGNTNVPVVMIAEKASDIIKQDWNS
ncbi:Glucose dehydrogenase [FAD quinone]-like 18, partial [Homarus americanus]